MNTPASRRFHSFLAPQLEAYVQFRQNLGYTSFAKPYNALDLDHYVLFYGIDSVEKLNEGAVFHWVHSIPERKAHTKNQRISFARGFFRYLIRVGLAQANPAQNIRRLIPKPPPRHIYTLLEIQQILDEARKLQGRTPKSVLLGSTLETMILLIYACGLRISEALKLTIEDVDFEENTLSLWRTKFHKERLVPFSDPIAQKLKSYLAIRRRCFPPQSDQAPFFCHKGGKYHGCTIEVHFLCLLIRCGLAKPGQGRGHPRIHDLRHTFACHRLYKC